MDKFLNGTFTVVVPVVELAPLLGVDYLVKKVDINVIPEEGAVAFIFTDEPGGDEPTYEEVRSTIPDDEFVPTVPTEAS